MYIGFYLNQFWYYLVGLKKYENKKTIYGFYIYTFFELFSSIVISLA